MILDTTALDRPRDSEEFRVNSYRLADFATALGDTVQAHVEGRRAVPIFAHVPVMQSMVESIAVVTTDFALHGEHDFHFHRPIVPGMRLWSRSTLIGLRNTRAGAAMIVESISQTEAGDRVCTQYTTCLVPGAQASEDKGRSAPASVATDGCDEADPIEITHALDGELTARYADAARDYAAYTLDAHAAAEAGYPAPIVHGMCAMGFACRAVVDSACDGDSTRLRRLGGRFAAPLFLKTDQTLTTTIRLGKRRDDARAVGFATTDADGSPIIAKGFAEVER